VFSVAVALTAAALLVIPAFAGDVFTPRHGASASPDPADVPVDNPSAGRGRGDEVAGRGCYPPADPNARVPGCQQRPPRRGAIHGRVRTSRGAPVAGARVYCGEAAAIADFEGTFQLKGVPEGAVACTAQGPKPLRSTSPTIVKVTAGGGSEATIVLAP
jgi:hypothetical protein